MEKGYQNFSKSTFFTPAFNSAIYDGPLRIYFSRHHESMALNLYFTVMKTYQEEIQQLKELSRGDSHCVFVLIYPDASEFRAYFSETSAEIFKNYGVAELEGHKVIGLNGPLEVAELEPVLGEIVAEVSKSSSSCLTPVQQVAL